jgi:hypothetical protein
MDGWRLLRKVCVGFMLAVVFLQPTAIRADDILVNIKEFLYGEDVPLTLKEAACLIDCIDKELFNKGTIGIKAPDIWGQNRMTAYRAEFEGQMAQSLGQFQTILQAAQRRSDVAVLTNATQLSATVAAAGVAAPSGLSGLGGRSRTPAVVLPTVIPTTAPTFPASPVTFNYSLSGVPSGLSGMGSAGLSGLPSLGSSAPASGGGKAPASASSSAPASGSSAAPSDPTSLLNDISQKLNALEASVLPLPANISNFATATGQPGVGIEPTLQLDEQANYINHLHQLRRVNSGDDLTDLAGYGLYLMRMPVSLVPGPHTRKGKGAVVTMSARHDLTDDLLPNTFRDVVVFDLTFGLTQVINEEIHKLLCLHCAPGLEAAGTPATTAGSGVMQMSLMTQLPANPSPVQAPGGQDIEEIKPKPGGDAPVSPLPVQAPGGRDIEEILKPKPGGEAPVLDADDNWARPGPNEEFRMDSQCMLPPEKTGAGPNSASIDELRIILGPASWPNAPTAKNTPAVKTGLVRSVLYHVPRPGGAVAASLPATLQGQDNRLRLLVNAINGGQQDPYRHDPTTLSLLRDVLLETHQFIRRNVAFTDLLKQPLIQRMGERYLRKDYQAVIQAREEFLKLLVGYRNHLPLGQFPKDWNNQVTQFDVLAFLIELQSVIVDQLLKEDMRVVFHRDGGACPDLDHLFFYEFEPTLEACRVFNEYVGRKWPLHVYSIDPVIDQQNVLDAFSRRTELQLALAVSVAAGKINVNNATAYARQLDLDLETVGLNRTSVAFGAGETTFGWRFYPRVQTPPSQSNPRRIASLLYWNGPRPDYDLENRRIEPGQRECIALIVTPNFIPSLKLSTVANWFDISGACAHPELKNEQMLELSHKLQKAKNALTRICDSRAYRQADLTHLTQRVKQLEELLPTQDYDVHLPDEGDLMGSEIFSENSGAGLAPTLLAWYGEHPQEGQNSTIFLLGRGFSVFETRVVAGGVDVPDAQKRLVSRNVMEIVIPSNARIYKHYCTDSHSAQTTATSGVPNPDPLLPLNPDPTRSLNPNPGQPLNPANPANPDSLDPSRPRNPTWDPPNPDLTRRLNPDPTRPLYPDPTKTKKQPCGWAVIDVHIATPNGISNHMYVETDPKATPQPVNNLVLTTTTSTTANPQQNNVTTATRVEATPPGLALPPLTVLPLGTQWPPFTSLAPGPVTGAPAGSLFPGMTNTPAPAATIPPPVLNSTAPNTGAVPATPGAASPAAPSATPAAAPPAAAPTPAAPLLPAGERAPTTGAAHFGPTLASPESIMQVSYTPGVSQTPAAQGNMRSRASIPTPNPATAARIQSAPSTARPESAVPSPLPMRSGSTVTRIEPGSRSKTSAAGTAPPAAEASPPSAKPVARRSLWERLGLSNP